MGLADGAESALGVCADRKAGLFCSWGGGRGPSSNRADRDVQEPGGAGSCLGAARLQCSGSLESHLSPYTPTPHPAPSPSVPSKTLQSDSPRGLGGASREAGLV